MNPRPASPDAPARLLASALRRMPHEQAEWGQAMLAELAYIEGRLARWQFALGCLRVALFPPREIILVQTAALPGERMFPQKEFSRPTAAALRGLLLLVPFLVANAIVANRIEPFFSLIRPATHTSAGEYVLLAAVLSLIPFGAFLAARPLFARTAPGSSRFPWMNALLAGGLLAIFLAVTVTVGAEIYRCDFLGIANCD